MTAVRSILTFLFILLAGIGNRPTSVAAATDAAQSMPTVVRFEDTDPAISYSGDWSRGDTTRSWSGGTAARGRFWMDDTGLVTTALFRFTGTGVEWIGMRGPQMGRAKVYLDGQRTDVNANASEETVGAVLFSASGLTDRQHVLRIETAINPIGSTGNNIIIDAIDVTTSAVAPPSPVTFSAGDIVVSLWTGEVQWRRADGSLFRTLHGAIPGTAAGMRFDPQGRLYVARWRPEDDPDSGGNTVERFDASGESLGAFGSGYDCDPTAIAIDPAGIAYVGQAGCSGAIVKLTPEQPGRAMDVAPEYQGSFWIDLAPDRCTLFYTSWGPAVKRFDACRGIQLQDFNAAPLPGGIAQDLRILPDGGVLVSSGDVIARLDSSGSLVQTYQVEGEYSPWAGLELAGDGSFWVVNYESSNVYRFALSSGAVINGFNTGAPPHTAIGLAIKK